MIIRFGVANHRSIREYQELSLVATKLKDDESGLLIAGNEPLHQEIPPDNALRVVPVVALYGANASGKSTVLHALSTLVQMIVTSHESRERRWFQPFLLDDESRKGPAKYDIDFVIDATRFHYGVETCSERIRSEWLYSYNLAAKRQTRTVLFHRDSEAAEEFYFGKTLKGENRQISRLVRKDSLFISAAAQNSHPQLTGVYDFFRNKFTSRLHSGTEAMLADHLVAYFGSSETRRANALSFLRAADVGVSGMDFSKIPVGERVKTFSKGLEKLLGDYLSEIGQEEEFSLARDERSDVKLVHSGGDGKTYSLEISAESAGTTSLLSLLGPIFERLAEGGVIIIDELNSTLHPLVSRKLIGLFSDPETNPKGAQAIFTTHDTNILGGGSLRRDQIWFAEKDREGATHLYAMSDIKVRASDNLEAGYLSGRFGAVPFYGVEMLALQEA